MALSIKPNTATGEHRMQCVFNKACADSQYGNLTVRMDDAVNRIFCHTYVRGNLLTLLHGLETSRPPAGGRLRGDEFKAAVTKLQEIAGADPSIRAAALRERPTSSERESDPAAKAAPVNVPLRRHEKEAARALADLYDDLVTDVSQMSTEAAQCVRKRPWMTPKLMQKWGVGWIPGYDRSLFRKNYLVNTHRNERGEVVSYSGRDLSFEEKWSKWLRHGRPDGKKPNKHRYVAGFHKGHELYGGFASRLNESYVRESLDKYGLVVVEGMNDVMRLEELGVAAVGITSNQATGSQVEKLVRFAQLSAHNRITLFPDCDEEGEMGFKNLLWKLSEHKINTILGCSRRMFNGQFSGKEPEEFTDEEWRSLLP